MPIFFYELHSNIFVDHAVFYDIWSHNVCKTTEIFLLTGSPNTPQPPISTSTAPGAQYHPCWETLG